MPSFDSKTIKRTFIETAIKTGLPLKSVGSAFSLSPAEILAQISGEKNLIGHKQRDYFERHSGIAFEDFLEGDVDAKLLRRRLLGEVCALPEKYAHSKYSHVRTTANVVEYLQFVQGWHKTRSILNHLQVPEGIFDFEEETINFLFFSDLFKILETSGIDESALKRMAFHSAIKNRSTALGFKFRNTRNLYEMYMELKRSIHSYDSNFNYRIEVDADKATLFTSYNPMVLDQLKRISMGNRFICKYKQQVFASIPIYVDRHPLVVT